MSPYEQDEAWRLSGLVHHLPPSTFTQTDTCHFPQPIFDVFFVDTPFRLKLGSFSSSVWRV
jgi:hypothetical protein